MNPQSSSNKNRASTDGTGSGREEEAEAPDPWPCSSSNQASLDGIGGGKEEEARTPNPHTCSSSNQASIALAAIEQVGMVPVMGNPNPHMRDTRRRMKVPIVSHQKSDATYTCFGFWLNEERLLSCPVEGEKYLQPLPPLPWLGHSESRRHPRLLKGGFVPSPSP